MIKVSNLSKSYGSIFTRKTKILNDVSFELPNKGLVAIFGKSGSGKTTLLNIIGGLDKQDDGYVEIDNVKITNQNRDKIRNKKIGFIFQNYYLEHGYSIGGILENQMKIAGFNDKEEIKSRIDKVLELVDLKKYEKKSADALSGGQKQRVAIARALIKGADIILADEPTGNLDSQNTFKVMDILKQISKEKLVVLVTHETSLIKEYADSHIELIDGKLVENTLVEDVNNYKFTKNEVQNINFSQSTSKKNGRLFNFKNIFSKDSESNLFKKIFICIMAILMVVFGYFINQTLTSTTTHKVVNQNALYTNLNSYTELPMLSQLNVNNEYYDHVDFYEINQKEGLFSYDNISSIKSIKESYTPKAIESNTTFTSLYGSLPSNNEVLISKGLANRIKHDIRLSELSSDEAILLMEFDNDYKIVGIVEGEENQVWFNKVDYVNFLNIYSDLKIVDNSNIFLEDTYANMTYSASIKLYEGKKDLKDSQIVIDISRNALYKMMSDTSTGDYQVEMANKELVNKTTAIYIENSEMYVKSFNITRESIDTDIVIYITQNALNNIFTCLTPNIETLGNDTSTTYYFEISTSNDTQYQNLQKRLKARGVSTIDIKAIYDKEDQEKLNSSMQIIYISLIGIALVYAIYYFIEMSESLKNSKEYGIYRAIGVNKSNLLFKETLRVIYKNVSLLLITMILGTLICSIYFGVSNLTFSLFIFINLGLFAISTLLMILISLIPYLFVITKTPSEIISRYDI
jgi:putative ABC transport system permease protein